MIDKYWEFLARLGDGRTSWTAEQNNADVAEIMDQRGEIERAHPYSWSVKITDKGRERLKERPAE